MSYKQNTTRHVTCDSVEEQRDTEKCRLQNVFNVSNRLARIGSVYQIYSTKKKGSLLLVSQARSYKTS